MLRPLTLPSLAAALALAACGGHSGPAGGSSQDPGTPQDPTGPLACSGAAAAFADRLLVGFSGGDATASKPGFDVRYQYLAGPVAPQADCYDPARTTTTGCGTTWWGTWQWDQQPPGQFVRDFVTAAEGRGLVPMFTWYVLLQASGGAEGKAELTQAATNAAFMASYLADYRFFLRQLGSHPAIVHLEPDLWGYAQQAAIDAGTGADGLPAAVASANPQDCAGYPDTVAGLGRCMIHMARVYAPAARVGLHASPWSTYRDCIQNTSPTLDVAAEARKTAAFLVACGAADGDLVVADLADRDAGWRQSVGQDTWLDATDRTLPTYAQAFRWSRALADGASRPVLWWQLPVGNLSLPDSTGAWRDNKVQYFFDHPDRVAAGGAIGMAFGAGGSGQTTPESDGGYLAARAAALAAVGGQPLCP